MEGTSGDVGSGESRVPERCFLARLAVADGVGRCLCLVDGELEGFGGMKKGEGEAMVAGGKRRICPVWTTRLGCVDHDPQFINHFTVTRPSLALLLRRLFISGRRSVCLPRHPPPSPQSSFPSRLSNNPRTPSQCPSATRRRHLSMGRLRRCLRRPDHVHTPPTRRCTGLFLQLGFLVPPGAP